METWLLIEWLDMYTWKVPSISMFEEIAGDYEIIICPDNTIVMDCITNSIIIRDDKGVIFDFSITKNIRMITPMFATYGEKKNLWKIG